MYTDISFHLSARDFDSWYASGNYYTHKAMPKLMAVRENKTQVALAEEQIKKEDREHCGSGKEVRIGEGSENAEDEMASAVTDRQQ